MDIGNSFHSKRAE